MTDKAQSTAEKNMKASQKAAAEQTKEAVESNSALKAPSASAQSSAQAEGIKDAIKEKAKDQYNALTDGNLPGAPPARQFLGMDDIMRFEPLLDLGVKEFEDRIAEKNDNPIATEKVAGLLSLERAGRNRTPYVKAMVERLGVDSPYEVTNAGPGYTNDVHPVTEL